MKLAKIIASHEFLLQMMIKGWNVQFVECTEGLPEGAILEYSYVDDDRGEVFLVVSHESFPESRLGYDIPTLPTPTFRRYYYPEVGALLEKMKKQDQEV